MKRTLIGLFVVGSLVGLGSVGVYFAQARLASQEEPAETFTDIPDRTPRPIQVAASAPGGAPSSPFADHSAASVEDQAYADEPRQMAAGDRYQSDMPVADQLPAEDHADYEPVDRYAESDIPVADGDIPDAAAPGNSPFAGQQAAGPQPASYPERQVAAEVAEPAAAEADPYGQVAAEPRRLDAAAPPVRTARSTAGNPLRSETPPAEFAADRYADPSGSAAAAPVTGEYTEPAATPFAGDASFDNHGPDGTGRPGDPQLNGPQAPALTIEKGAPPEIQIGKPAKFAVKVKNVGTATAHDVEVHDIIPQGTQLLDTVPPAERGADGELVWALGAMKPGEERMVEMQLMPTAEGEVGSVATVRFHAQASVRTLATKPMLNIEVLGPSQVLKGQPITLRIKLSNPGSGAANGVMISEQVPEGLSHAAGRELEFEVGTLKPGESRELDLTLMAAEAGMATNVILAEADVQLRAEARTEIEIVAPLLQVSMSGPKRRYLERNATHNISVTNPGTAPAKNIDLVAVLPRTMKFVEANNGGHFDAATHAVYWNLEELPPQETGTVKLTTLPIEAGDAKVVIKTSSESGLKDEREEVVSIEGLAAINFQLSDVNDPIEVGGETAYEIRVTNQGTKAATNVHLAALLPRGMKPLSAEGPVRFKIDGQRVLFEPLKTLAPKADTVFMLKVQAIEPGDQRVEVQVATDEIRDPITKEESTRVYGDE